MPGRLISVIGHALVGIVLLCSGGICLETEDIPSSAPRDGIMAGREELRHLTDWAHLTFTGELPREAPNRIGLRVIRQDHSVLRFGESCIGTPLRIGGRAFERGLGTHANSAIEVDVLEGAVAFRAFVGIDNNHDTGGARGSVRFAVEAEGVLLAETGVLTGADEGHELIIDLPVGVRTMILRTDTTGDGPAHDQADWAEARFVMQDGTERHLDENQVDTLFVGAEPPFSFTYADRPSQELLWEWERHSLVDDRGDHSVVVSTWRDPITSLVVTAEGKVYKEFPAVEWIVSFENTGSEDTPILERVNALDVGLRSGYTREPLMLHHLNGDQCSPASFEPRETQVESGGTARLAAVNGRSSQGDFPFFDVTYADKGLICAIGWSGQWEAVLERSPTGPARLRAGMEGTYLVLHPGERIRTPRILLMHYEGDAVTAHNRFRRLILAHYSPRLNDRAAPMPVALQCFDRYFRKWDAWATEVGQLEGVAVAQSLGCDAYWLDAAWFPLGFPTGVGNWTHDGDAFPNGLRPVGAACDKAGLRFILWFEPERVAPGSEIATEHPEFVHGGAAGGLFRLDDPEARRWLTARLSSLIAQYRIDVYRNDFNIDPLGFWRANDAPDRQGMTEIRYVEGHYAMWDELLERHPGLMIDNCASGGRRIDLETCTRSVPLWRSDTNCFPGSEDLAQAQTWALSRYLPLHSGSTWAPDAYRTRSAMTSGLALQWDYRSEDFDMDAAREAVAELESVRKYYYGDYYALTPHSTGTDGYMAFQFHRADLDSGIILAFRRRDCPLMGIITQPAGIRSAGRYKVSWSDESRQVAEREMTGRELLAEGVELRVREAPGSLLVRYEPAG